MQARLQHILGRRGGGPAAARALSGGCGVGGDGDSFALPGRRVVPGIVAFSVSSPAFEHQGTVPRRHSCEGDDVSPPLEWAGAPDGTRSLALVVDDPDAPTGTFTHWTAWGIDPAAVGLAEGEAAPIEGQNDFGSAGYRGPCPPPGHGPHRYFFRLYALDAPLDLQAGAAKEELERALGEGVLAVAELVGTYER